MYLPKVLYKLASSSIFPFYTKHETTIREKNDACVELLTSK